MSKTKAIYKKQLHIYLKEIRSNKHLLMKSIEKEHFEKSAKLRDQIKLQQKELIHYLANLDLESGKIE